MNATISLTPATSYDSQSNAQMLIDFYDAFASGDIEAVLGFVSTDFVLHVPGNGRTSGEYWGREGIREFMTNIGAYSGGLFDLQVPVLAVTGEHGFSREVLRVNRVDDPLREWTLRISNHFVMRGGKLVEFWVIPEEQHLYDEYWTSSARAPGRSDVAWPTEKRPRHLVHLAEATSQENARLLYGMYEQFWNGDMDAMRQRLSEDVIVNIVGQSAMSGVYHGWDGYMTFRQKLMGMAGSKYKLDVIALAASARDVFAIEYIRMDRHWDPAVQTIYVLMHFEIANGKITRMDDFPLDTYAWERFYTPPSR